MWSRGPVAMAGGEVRRCLMRGSFSTLPGLLLWFSMAVAQPAPGPHPFWALVRGDGGLDASAIRAQLRDSLLTALRATGIAPEGYPRPCAILRTPDPKRPAGWFQVSCVEPAAGAEADGILLGPEKEYVALEVVDYPSARAFLLEVYLVPHLPYAPLTGEERYDLPRVVVFHPLVPGEWHPAIWRAIERGVAAAGATPLSPGGEIAKNPPGGLGEMEGRPSG